MDIFVKRPILALVVSCVFMLAGLYALKGIAVLQFPKIESAKLDIRTQYSGASAEVVQGFITSPLERVAMTVPGVDYVDSRSQAGLSHVTAWLSLNEDSTDALAELSARINQVRYELPAGAQDPAVSVVRADRPNAVFYLDVEAENFSRPQLSNFLRRQVNPILASISGVQRIGFEGGRDPAMRVWLDPLKLAAYELGANEVLAALSANNVVAALGRSQNAQEQITLLSNATLKSPDDFKNLLISLSPQAQVRLGDIARIELFEDRGDISARMNKRQTVYLSVWPLPGANEIAIGDELYKRLDSINATLPEGLRITIGYDGTLYMRDAIKEIFTTLVETVVLVGIVVLALMGSLRSALVPLVTIPISILGTIAAMYIMGFSLNLLTILAIVLSVGLVVDDAIVVVENVARYMRQGHSRLDAALKSSRELLSPIIAMTLTLAAVYAPIGFVSGLTGSLFKEFAFSLAVAVLISGVVALTLAPIMSAYLSAHKGRESRGTVFVNQWFDALQARYGAVLATSLNHKAQLLFVGVLISLLVVPFYLFSAKELAPIEDQGTINVVIESAPQASLAYTAGEMDKMTETLMQTPGFDQFWSIATPNGGFGGLDLVPYAQREQSVHDLLPQIYARMSQETGLRVFPILEPALPAAGQFGVEMVVQSIDSYEQMQSYAQALIQAANQSGVFLFADTDLKITLAQQRLMFKHQVLADVGLTVEQVSLQLSALLSEQEINRFNADGRAYRVIPLLEPHFREDGEQLLNLQLKTPSGALIPLRTIAYLTHETSPQVLGNFNQQRAFRIRGAVVPGFTTDQALSVLEEAAEDILPSTYRIDYAGVSRQLRQEGNSLFGVLALALIVVYLLLAIQFNSLRSPLVVLLGSVPLALSGALLFSYLSWTSINLYSQIGLVTLVGLIAKNGILITEFANHLQQQGLAKIVAINQAAQTRLRPILMTTAATVLGHLPLVLVSGAGAEARNSIGIVLVAGMLIGTVFTLFILPSVYLLFGDNIQEKD